MFRKTLLPCYFVPMAVLCFGLAAASVHADQIFNASGSSSDGDLLAQADFIMGNGSLTIVLKDLVPNEKSIGQAISDLSFTISGGTAGAMVTSATGNAVNVISPTMTTPATGSTDRWQVQPPNMGSSVTITVLTGGQPNYLIAGPTDSNGNYPNENASMEVHSPVFVETATITLTDMGITSASTISDVTFSFGTGPDHLLPGTPGAVPEPASVVLGIGGAIFLVSLARLSRRWTGSA
jgi:hypothetical protein